MRVTQYDFDTIIERRGSGDLMHEALKPRWGRDDLPPMQGIESIQHSAADTQKILRDGQVIILRGGREYTILGSER